MRIRALITDETVVVGINNPRNSSKIAFCIPIGSARMRLIKLRVSVSPGQ